jgi:hypothetical protein
LNGAAVLAEQVNTTLSSTQYGNYLSGLNVVAPRTPHLPYPHRQNNPTTQDTATVTVTVNAWLPRQHSTNTAMVMLKQLRCRTNKHGFK